MHTLCHTLVLGDRVIIKNEKNQFGKDISSLRAQEPHSFFPEAISIVHQRKVICACLCVCIQCVCVCVHAWLHAW